MDVTDSSEQITPEQFHEVSGADDWRVIGEGVCAYFRTGSLVAGDAPRVQRNRLHIDVYVPYDQAEARITAALVGPGRSRG